MIQKIFNKQNFLILNGSIMIIMGIIWLLYQTTELIQYSMLFYDIREYAELAIILLLGVMLIDRIKPQRTVGIIMLLVSIFIGIAVANNQIDLLKFSSLEKEWFYRSIVFIAIYLSLINLIAIDVNFKRIWHYKAEMLIIISLIGIIIYWTFTAYKSRFYISHKPIQTYHDLVNFYININQISTTLGGVGFIILGLNKFKPRNK
ncbi:MAG: hypothetical protein JXR88_15250 [Clostridia bacterium]|nr:hypothetical protein [Clostridia bacterium]